MSLPGLVELSDGRFRAPSLLGDGGMGVVYRVHDTKLGDTVAAKTLAHLGSEEIYRLKKEFRTLAELRHRNLVRLHELFVGESHCFFTMELVTGATFVEHVRGRATGLGSATPATDFDRLREALIQLGEGLHFLHSRGIVHRDIKPTNVLVDRTGRVVLLDFGLATNLLSKESRRSRERGLAGTFAYMSPEQLAGSDLTPASDWYSLGVMLFEALTQRLPFGEESFSDLLLRARRAPPSPRTLASDVPDDLDALTSELLAPAADRRASGAEILLRLRTFKAPFTVTIAAQRAPSDVFVGRRAQLDSLSQAFAQSRAGLMVAEVVGPSGIGKSALVEHFLSELDPATAVLRSRCHPRESVPFKAIDGIIDGLARLLTQLDEGEVAMVLPRTAAALPSAFPVMGRVPALAAADHVVPAIDPHERRRQAFAALRELLARLSDRRPIVLWIDDAQWGDADSTAVLRAICIDDDPPRALLVLSHRPPDEAGGSLSVLVEGIRELCPDRSRLELGAMPCDELRALVGMWMQPAVRDAAAQVDAIVDGADGSPFLAIELTRSLSSLARSSLGETALDGLLLARVEGLSRSAREAVELLAVAGHPVEESLIAAALGRRIDELWDLADQRLLRLLPQQGKTAVAIYHDALREAVVANVDPAEKRNLHRRLASALQRYPGRHDESRIDHLLAAGDLDDAAEAAYEEAEVAAGAATFHRAVSLYLKAIELGTRGCPQWLLLSKLADCLVAAGRGAEAAPRFLEAADRLERDSPADLEALALRRKAAAEFLRGGFYEEGYRVLGGNFRRMRLPFASHRIGALWRISSTRVRIGAHRWLARAASPGTPRRVTPHDREKLELTWAAGHGSSFMDVLRAAAFQVQHAELAMRIGDPRHLARATATEALFVAFERGDRGVRRCESLLVEAEGLAAESGDAGAVVHALLMRSITTLFLGRLRESVEIARTGETKCRRDCRGADWEIVAFQQNLLCTLALMGQLAEADAEMGRALREARDRGEHLAQSILPVGVQNIVWLAADAPELAEEQVQKAVGAPFESPHPYCVYLGEIARGYIDLYVGEPEAGLDRMNRLWGVLRRGYLLRLVSLRSNVRELRASCALQIASRSPRRREQHLALAEKDARKMRREHVDWLEARADRIEGMVAAARGDPRAAAALLDRAARRFERVDMGLCAAAARWRAADLVEDETAAAAQRESAEAWMIAHGVRKPEKMVRLY